jgi:outer membrane protein TolC
MRSVYCLLICVLVSCDGGFREIDQRVDAIMARTSTEIGAIQPSMHSNNLVSPTSAIVNPTPHTKNPSIDLLEYIPAGEFDVERVAESLDRAAEELEASSKVLTLQDALSWSNTHAREMNFAEYDYLSSTLSLLSELHLWGPRFFNTISTDVDADSTDGSYVTSLTVVNDFSMTHQLPSGGSVSASALTTIARSLHNVATSDESADSTLDIAIEIPLFRGSGAVARESLIQAKRNLVYAARSYERFRRTFFRKIVGDYLGLVVQKKSLENAQRGVDSLRQLARRQAALYEAGRTRFYDSADAENQALGAVAKLSQSWERYRLALDRFKIRIGWPSEDRVQVEPSPIGLLPPSVDAGQSIERALLYRLDLQNERDQVEDVQRAVLNTLDELLPDVRLTASAVMGSDTDKAFRFGGNEVDFLAGLSVSLPLDRGVERIAVRSQQIVLEKSRRSYRESRDNVAVAVRSALRNIEVFQFSLDLQERNVQIAQVGLDSINADPDRVSVLDQTRAISDLQSAKDARDSAAKDLDLSIIDYLLQAGQLRINDSGGLLLPPANPE